MKGRIRKERTVCAVCLYVCLVCFFVVRVCYKNKRIFVLCLYKQTTKNTGLGCLRWNVNAWACGVWVPVCLRVCVCARASVGRYRIGTPETPSASLHRGSAHWKHLQNQKTSDEGQHTRSATLPSAIHTQVCVLPWWRKGSCIQHIFWRRDFFETC